MRENAARTHLDKKALCCSVIKVLWRSRLEVGEIKRKIVVSGKPFGFASRSWG
ncbi:hypothetical protein [Tolypothrix sp. VBCCA 56010]|uniref:hypothetical protein n=1 Tax=Tolypothrix sp. VBCCA 56010 TaxID=3137731 RepID=UPI003D7D18E0